MAWDRFAYGLNNPIRFNDPTGHISCDNSNVAEGDCSDLTPEERLDQFYGVDLDGEWSEEEILYVLTAIADAGYAFAREIGGKASAAFKAIYGVNDENRFKFDRCPQNDCGDFGRTRGSRHISIAGFYSNGDVLRKSVNLVVHELGHAFDNRLWAVINGVNDRMGRYLVGRRQALDPNFPVRIDGVFDLYGFASRPYVWQQSAVGTPGEEFPDMVLGWVYNQWDSSVEGQARADFMSRWMPILTFLASR